MRRNCIRNCLYAISLLIACIICLLDEIIFSAIHDHNIFSAIHDHNVEDNWNNLLALLGLSVNHSIISGSVFLCSLSAFVPHFYVYVIINFFNHYIQTVSTFEVKCKIAVFRVNFFFFSTQQIFLFKSP